MSSDGFAAATRSFLQRLDADASRRILLFGGKGGVGKTTISSIAALHLAGRGPVILFSTDPASNLDDLFPSGSPLAGLTIEPFDPASLWQRFMSEHLDRFVEIGDRGTYLDRDEIRRLLELAVPGIDELTGWMRIGELAETNPGATIVVDTAPTGHTLRLLSSSKHFSQLTEALEEMQAKHRALVEQLTRRRLRDEIDRFIESFRGKWEESSARLRDAATTAFLPVFLAEPWVIAQTKRLVADVRAAGIEVPMAILNRSRCWCDCERCARRCDAEREATGQLGLPVVPAPESPFELRRADDLHDWLAGGRDGRDETRDLLPLASTPLSLSSESRLVFFAGKGGVGKTTVASSVALQLATREPERKFVVISVDPAHALRDAFADEEPPPNLAVEIVDTRAEWERFRRRMGGEIERALTSMTPGQLSLEHDARVIAGLLDTAPPGADEIFAIARLSKLLDDESVARVLVDTAPTGHFLRLLDLPREAGEWVRELMRLLLRYKEIVPPGRLAEELLDSSRSLRRIGEALRSGACETVVVTRAGEIVENETGRLLAELRSRAMRIAGVVLNAYEPQPGCPFEAAPETTLASSGASLTVVPRTERPPSGVAALRALVPLE